MAPEKIIHAYVRKDQINISIIKRMGEARSLIPQYGFKFEEEDISHDFEKQKDVHKTYKTREYPLFEYRNGVGPVQPVGKLEALKEFLENFNAAEVVEPEDIGEFLEQGNELNEKKNKDNNNNNEEKEKEEEKNEEKEEEVEPTLGIISQSLLTVEGIVKYSTSWVTSWFYTPTTITPLPEAVNNITVDNTNNNDDNNIIVNKNDDESEVKEEKKESQLETLRDFKVVQTNWYWRQQNRIIRFDLNTKTMYRYDPADLTIRAIHPLSLLKDITCYNSQYFFQLTFQKGENDSGVVYEYYTSSSSDYPVILNLLTTHSNVDPNVNP